VTCRPSSNRISSGQIKLCITNGNTCVPNVEYTAWSSKVSVLITKRVTQLFNMLFVQMKADNKLYVVS